MRSLIGKLESSPEKTPNCSRRTFQLGIERVARDCDRKMGRTETRLCLRQLGYREKISPTLLFISEKLSKSNSKNEKLSLSVVVDFLLEHPQQVWQMCQMPNIWHIYHIKHQKSLLSDVLNRIKFTTCEQYRCKFATVRTRMVKKKRVFYSFSLILFYFLSSLSFFFFFLSPPLHLCHSLFLFSSSFSRSFTSVGLFFSCFVP